MRIGMGSGVDSGMDSGTGTGSGMDGGMESGPAVFAGVSLALFGAGLLLWTFVRLRSRRPVAEAAGVSQAAAVATAVFFGVISLMTGGWVLSSG
ncbi:MAG: hypothetical protein ACRDP3_04900 [Streptomyces sp.]|uniref:hypothetical protein n=1 Tax=Streptomyces sp. TaxID=1931 RepID=UPI003D6C41E2